MEFDKIYKELMESLLRDADPNSQRVIGGRRAEDIFYHQISKGGKYRVKKATPEEDRTERWDFKLYEDIGGKFLPAFPTISLNVQNPTISKLMGTVDVKSSTLTGEFSPVYLITDGRGTAWCRGVNWIAVPEGSTFRLIHCNSLMYLLKKIANIVVENPEESTARILFGGSPVRFVSTYRDVNIEKGILFEHPTTHSKGVVVKTNTLKSISILL
jgi:hypothetical protein